MTYCTYKTTPLIAIQSKRIQEAEKLGFTAVDLEGGAEQVFKEACYGLLGFSPEQDEREDDPFWGFCPADAVDVIREDLQKTLSASGLHYSQFEAAVVAAHVRSLILKAGHGSPAEQVDGIVGCGIAVVIRGIIGRDYYGSMARSLLQVNGMLFDRQCIPFRHGYFCDFEEGLHCDLLNGLLLPSVLPVPPVEARLNPGDFASSPEAFPRVIALSGKMRSGKGEVEKVCIEHGFYPLNFADALKAFCMEIFGFSWEQVYTQEGKECFDPIWGTNARRILQVVGSEYFRGSFGHRFARTPSWQPHDRGNFWVKVLQRRMQVLSSHGVKRFVIGDARFPNEAEAVSQSEEFPGVVWRIERPGIDNGKAGEHISETALDDWKAFDATITNDGTLEDLRAQVLDLLDSPGKGQEAA